MRCINRDDAVWADEDAGSLAQVSLASRSTSYGEGEPRAVRARQLLKSEYHEMADPIDMKGTASGRAALSICESLLIALSDLKIMGAKETSGVLRDAAAAHRNAGGADGEAVLHLEVAAIIERIIAGRNSTQHP